MCETCGCDTLNVYVAIHCTLADDGEITSTEFGTIYTTEKEANKAAKAWKSECGFKGKEAKKHEFIVECQPVFTKFVKD
jgi:hypothetical protein